MTELEVVITRGLPASGKSTLARAWVAEDPTRRVRVNRDDYRRMLFNLSWGLTHQQEDRVTDAQHAAVRALLAAGMSVIVDDTNLRLRNARAFATIAAELGGDFRVIDVETSMEECIARDAVREHKVGWEVIRDMAARFANRPEVTPNEETAAPKVLPYVPNPDLPDVWLVDVDGTLAIKDEGEGSRGWYDWARVGEDSPNETVIRLARTIADTGPALVIMSARDSECRRQTTDWLREHLGRDYLGEVYMRRAGDTRRDDVVKLELFDTYIRPRFNVRGVLDDRNQVVQLWRALGLTCLQVADGNF